MNVPIIAIVGPTATGKSDLALEIAKKHNCEIVSADSWLVRKYVDIGTAKPSLNMRQEVPHYLIDVVEPDEDFSAATYKELALKAILDIQKRGKVPLLVGGTGLYIDAILYDFSFAGESDPRMRQKLNSLSLDELHQMARSKGLDLSQIDVRNKRRVIRLIESEGKVATKKELRPNTLIIGLSSPLELIKRRIEERVKQMIAQGLEDEVKLLSDRYGWSCEALKGIGYSEWQLYFNNKQSLEETQKRITKDSIDLAKRQLTWFKRNLSIHWYPTPVNIANVDELITTFLNNYVSL